jgi:hypothetical protein
MGDKTVSVRVRFEGGDQVKSGLQEVGREGTRALQTIGNVSRQTGAQLQNAGYQVSDFFVQVAGGTAPTRALAQQLPQLLQGFGLIGVAASVAIAALPSLWALFGSGAEDAEALEKQLQGVSKSVDAYTRAADLAIEPMDRLIKTYGEQAEAIRKTRQEDAELRRGQAVRAVTDLLGSVPDRGGTAEFTSTQMAAQATSREQALARLKAAEVEFRAAAAAGDQERMQALAAEELAIKAQLATLSDIRDAVAATASEFGVTTSQAANLAVAVERVRESASQGAAQQIAAASALRDYLVEVYGSADAANEATGGLVERLNAAITAAADVAAAASTIAGAIGAGANEAARLAQNLASARAYGKIQNAGLSGPDSARFATWELNSPGDLDGELASGAGGVRKFSGGGGGGGGGSDPDLARAKSLTEAVRTETEKYAFALEEVNRLKQKGLITDETYSRQLDKLNDKLGETGDLGKKAASAIRSAFDGLFDDPQQALKDLAKQLAMMALYQGLAKSFPSVFGSGGFVPLGVPGFATGGRHRGGLRIVGENGPELEATGPSMIYPADALARMGRGAGANVAVNVFNQSGGEVQQRESRGPNGERQIDIMIGRSLASGRQDGALRSRYGAPPQAVKR